MGPGVVSPIYKLMYLGSSTNEIDEGVKRIDRIFDEQVLPETAVSHLPASYDIEFRHVSFAYENKAETTRTEALKDISFTAATGSDYCAGRSVRFRKVYGSQPDSALLGCQ